MFDPNLKLPQTRAILLVEDDPIMQRNLEHLIQTIDNDIIVDRVATAEEAKDLMDHRDNYGDYSLVISDQFLEGQGTGLELWDHCRKKHPSIPFILTSGTNLFEALSLFKTIESCPPFLKKPFSSVQGRFIINDLLKKPARYFQSIGQFIPAVDKYVGSALAIFSILLVSYTVSIFKGNDLSFREIMESPPVQDAQPAHPVDQIDWKHFNFNLWRISALEDAPL
jgi:CheY-like chemotaxis protein